MFIAWTHSAVSGHDLEKIFKNPPDDSKPWVFWFWINGNISKDGITKDLEAMKRVGINGVLWMEVSGPWWAPQGPIEAGTKEWRDAMQWAISEADRLGMAVDLSVDFGYGCGGPHITPDKSMQQIVRTETRVEGGKTISIELKKPEVDYHPMLKNAWLRPGTSMSEKVLKALDEIDSYRDIAVFAIKTSGKQLPLIEDNELANYDGRRWNTYITMLRTKKGLTPVPLNDIIDLTDKMDKDGKLDWSAPEGNWNVVRLGHASNFKFTRPCPGAAVGLECDRLNKHGMDAHFQNHLKPILESAGDRAGRTLQYFHIDSWEAGGQNWSAGFADEFKKRRGYDIRPWLPALMGCVVESAEMTDRFFWDMRKTVSELMLDNYIDRLRELSAPYGVNFSCESYGDVCVDDLTYGGRADLPIAEFWTEKQFGGAVRDVPLCKFGEFKDPAIMNKYCFWTMKAQASVANTYGKPRVGAESFTGSRGWSDHPWLLKNMGDEAFANGINHYIYHLSAHQAYDNMVPGLTHRKWGQHIQRHQTWWEYSKPYFDYIARSQALLSHGRTVVDIAYLYHEGAPVSAKDGEVEFNRPQGYDYDFCSSEIIQKMEFKDGRIQLPSGVSYRYLLLPKSGRLTLETARKIEELRKAGASIIQQVRISGTPGLENYPEADNKVMAMAQNWPTLPKEGWADILAQDNIKPDFEGDNLHWIHRRSRSDDIYFIANSKLEAVKLRCTFRVTGKEPELWNPETGDIFALSNVQQTGDRTTVELKFEPSQSWFVVFPEKPSAARISENPFCNWKLVEELNGSWNVAFDPNWGQRSSADSWIVFDKLEDWSAREEPGIKYYSGTATYLKEFDYSASHVPHPASRLCIDLGKVEVIARVILNGRDCGIAWKPPYRVDITDALKSGRNELQIEVANTWVNRLIGDEQLPLDSKWHNWETLMEWPDWFKGEVERSSGRYTFTSARHYNKNSQLHPAGLLGPVSILSSNNGE